MTTNDLFCRGKPYQQFYHHFPILEPLYTSFEKKYDTGPLQQWMRENNYVIPVVAVVLYLAFCYFGQIIMKNRQPFKLTQSLAYWNLFLSVFSCYGAIRTVPHMLYRMATQTFEETVCDSADVSFGAGACGLAVQLFILSKIPELIDTVFIVLRKRPLIFLHWYHHVTVLLYCWNSYVTESSAGLYFASMNYSVHAVMYFYYYLAAARRLPKSFPSWIITIFQISQMIVGTGVVCACLYYYKYGGKKYGPQECNNTESNLVAGGVMYASYLYLFVEFAVKRFVFGIKEEDSRPSKVKKLE